MKAMMLTMTLFVGSCVAMLAAGCAGGGNEETPTASAIASPVATEAGSPTPAGPSPTLPAQTRAELEALLKAAALQVEDLPSGFTLEEERFFTNEEAAADDPIDPQKRLSDFNEWGRLLSYQVSYKKEAGLGALLGGTISISNEIAVYQDADGAKASMAASRERVEDPELAAKLAASFESETMSNASVTKMAFAEIGDETQAMQITADVSEPTMKVVVQGVGLREGRVIGSVMTVAANAPSPTQELESLARKLDDRIGAALKNPPKPTAATPAPTTTATPKATPTPAAGLSRSNPIPLGQTAVVPPGWEVTVLAVDEDAWPEVQAENTFNDPPEQGYRMVLITVRVTNVQTKDEAASISEGDFELVGSRNQVYSSFERSCGVTPNDLMAELFPEGTAEGTVCFQAGTDETGLILIARPSWDKEDHRYFALQ